MTVVDPSSAAPVVDPSSLVVLVVDVPGTPVGSWENVSEAARRANVERPLTRSLDLGEEGLAMQATREDIDRFWAKVAIGGPGDCWLFTAACDADGYGTFWINGATRRAPRVAWLIANPGAVIPAGQQVRHRCDNPPCVNPAHLVLGAAKENAQDRVERDRSARGDRNGSRTRPERLVRGPDHPNYRAGECRNGHPADRRYTAPNGERICRDCAAAHRRRQRARHKDQADYAERRARINEAKRRWYAARKAAES